MKSGKCVGWDWDIKSGRYFWFGDLQTQFGIPSDTYVARVGDFHRRIHPEDRERVDKAVKDAMQNQQRYAEEFRIFWMDGTVRWVSADGEFYYAANGYAERMLGISVDITDRKRVEERLREYEKAVEGSEEMIAVVDREYRYLIANRKFLDHRKMTKEQVVGRFAPEVLNKGVFETVVKEKLDECFRGKVVRYEMKYTYPDLGERDLFISNFPIDGANGIDRVACILQDITERKRAEEALASVSRRVIDAEESERRRIAQDLHEDIGQRLALLAIEIERLKTEPLNQTGEMLTRIDDLWKHTLGILTDVKISAHELHSPRLEYLGIAAVMRSFCEEFGQRKGVEIEFRSHDLLSFVTPDTSLCLFRVLQEGLYNAVKHSGVRHFEVELGEQPGEIHLTVSDSGAGFDIKEGRGLGLTGMQERLKLLKGTFSIDSQTQHGTTIHARVPLSSGRDSMCAAR
jgi:PAS domain S-box-containing protein